MKRRLEFERLCLGLTGILLLLCFALWTAGCGERQPSVSSGAKKITQKTALHEIDRGEAPETPQSGIQKDLQSGKITEEQAVILGLKAVFSPKDLPQEYQRPALKEERPNINGELQWIADNLDKLDSATREKLEPFILPPKDPKSFFHPESKAHNNTFALSLFTAKTAWAAEEDAAGWKTLMCEIPGSGKQVTVYYYLPPGSSPSVREARKQKAFQVKEAITTAWPKFKELLKVEPDKPFDVYLTDLRRDASWGLAWWNNDSARCEMSIHDGLEGPKLKTTTVHELFHCFQLYIPHRFSLNAPDKMWLLEATATWAEHYVYPRFNVEHRWLSYFFRTLYPKRMTYNGCHEYASYPLFFFASDVLNDRDYVRRVLAATKNEAIAAAVTESTHDFAGKYAQFAVYNWNWDPFLLYSDPPNFPAYGASGDSVSEVEINEADFDRFRERLRPGGISYWRLKFNPDAKKINKVVFKFRVNASNPHIRRQALVKIEDEWVLEDWNGIEERTFCREEPGQKVDEVVVVLSNADFKNRGYLNFDVDTTEKCPQVLAGYTRITERHEGEGLKSEIVYCSQDVVEYDPAQKAYLLKSMSASYSFNEKMEGQMVLGIGKVTHGSGSLLETYPKGEQPVKILKKAKETILMLETKPKNAKWVNYNQAVTVEYAGTENETWQDSPMGFWPKNIALTEDEVKPDRIKGVRTIQTTSEYGTTGKMVVEFEYELK